jgi:nitroreductase
VVADPEGSDAEAERGERAVVAGAVRDRPSAQVVFEVLGTARAMRSLRPDPVDPAVVDAVVWAATRAASPNNSQLWHFVVLTDPARRAALAAALRPFGAWIDELPPLRDASEARTRAGARRLLATIADAPVIVVVCAQHAYPPGAPESRYLWTTVGGAAQNLVVAARALGLGTVVTMFHVLDEQAVADVLEIPEGVRVGAIIPMGWPGKPFGAVRRRPLSEVLHHERW